MTEFSLSPNTIQLLDTLSSKQNDHLPPAHIIEANSEKDFLAFVGPPTAGKSTLAAKVAELDRRFVVVGGGVTRAPEERDTAGQLEYIEHSDSGIQRFNEMLLKDEIMQYMIHPTTRRIYFTRISDYSADKNIKEVTASGLPAFKKLGFRTLSVFGIVLPSHQWHHRFTERYPNLTDERAKRLRESKTSEQSQIDMEDVVFIDNRNGNLDAAARTVIDISDGLVRPDNKNRQLAIDMLTAMNTMG